MGTLKKLRKKVKKAVGGVTRQVGRSTTQIGQSAGKKAAWAAPYVGGTLGYVYGGPEGAGLGAGLGTTLDRKYNHDKSWKEALGSGVKAGLGTYGAMSILDPLANYLTTEAMGALGYGPLAPAAPAATGATGAAGGNAVLDPVTGQATSYVPKTVGAAVPGAAPSAAPGLLGNLGGYGQYITPGNLMLGGLGYGLLKGGTGPQDDGKPPAPGTFSPQLPSWYDPNTGTQPNMQTNVGQPYQAMNAQSAGMMNQMLARMQNPQMMQNPMQNPMFTR